MNSPIVTEELDERLYGDNSHEVDTLRAIRHRLDLSEISECDSSDTDNITLSRIQKITASEIARFEPLTKQKSSGSSTTGSAPPPKKPRTTNDDGESEDELPRLDIPSSICDDATTDSDSPDGATSGARRKTAPEPFPSDGSGASRRPKILDLDVLTEIGSATSPDPPGSSDGGGVFGGACPPRFWTPAEEFPAICRITAEVSALQRPSSASSHEFFRCILDAGEVGSEVASRERKVALGGSYVSYKELAGKVVAVEGGSAGVKMGRAPCDALAFRKSQSSELVFYENSSASSEGWGVSSVSESEGARRKGSFWSKCFCFELFFPRRRKTQFLE